MTLGRGDTVEFEAKGRGKLTGIVSSTYVALGNSPRVTIKSGGQKYTRLAASVTLVRKAAQPPAAKPGLGHQAAGHGTANRGQKFAAETLTPGEVDALIAQCSRRAFTGIRNRALILLLYRSGLRISEALALRPSDLDFDTHSIRLLDTKSGRAQTRGFLASADDALTRWIEARKKRGFRNGKLFCTYHGGDLSEDYVRVALKRMAKDAGLEKRVHPHMLRHTFAKEREAEGMPITTISKLLGHSSVAVTARYLDHLTNHQAVMALAAMNKPGDVINDPEGTIEDEVAALREQVASLTVLLGPAGRLRRRR